MEITKRCRAIESLVVSQFEIREGVDGQSPRDHLQAILSAQGSIGACTMHDPAMEGNVIRVLVFVGLVYSIYLAGRIAERRGRSFKTWASIAGIIGPLALPLLFLLPNPQRKDPEGPNGEKRPSEMISAGRPVTPSNPDPDQFNLSFA
jgi:hypothetical protein